MGKDPLLWRFERLEEERLCKSLPPPIDFDAHTLATQGQIRGVFIQKTRWASTVVGKAVLIRFIFRCPGRHFASNEILAVVTMFVLRYDMAPKDGQWSLPETKKTNVASVVMEPDTDIEVELSLRKGYEDGRWAFGLKDSEKIFAVAAEDHE